MAKDPAVLFYTQDFITGTILMTDEQRGKYIILLCLQHQNGKLTERDMLKICGGKDADIWAKFYEEEGYFYNKRMLLETKKRNNYTESRRKNLEKGVHMDSHMGQHMENENEDVNIIEYKNELLKKKEEKFKSEVFEFLEKYPKAMLDKFCNYWMEKNKSGTKMRFELERTFEITRRLVTWASRDKEFNKTEPVQEIITYKELVDKFNKGDTAVWEQYEQIKVEGKDKPMWKLKKQMT